MVAQDDVLLEYRTIPEIVTRKLRNAILQGELKPGERLVQDDLARRYGVSRMPIREACRILEGEGLITFHPHQGAMVTVLSVDEICEIFTIRALLEGMATRLAAQHMTPEIAHELRQLLSQMETAQGDPDRYLNLNHKFHYTLFRATGRTRLLSQIKTLRNTVEPYLRLHLSVTGRPHDSLNEHRAIYEASVSGDSEAAEKQAQYHLHRALEVLLASLPEQGIDQKGLDPRRDPAPAA